MITRPATAKTLLSLALFLALSSARAEDVVKYAAQPGSEVKIEGTSNIHDWTVKGQIISGFMEVSPAFDADLKTVTPAPKVEVTIPVRSLKSSSGKKMDEVMQEHMNMAKFPTIKYQLTSLTVKTEPKGPNGPGEYVSKGDLTVSGVKKAIEMPVTIEKADGKLKVKGTIPLKMTDFNIKPPAPALAMGLIKTGDDVKITLEWVLAKAEAK